MKILISAYDYPPRIGGVATCGFETARALAQAGTQVRVLTIKRPGGEEFDRHGLFETRRITLPQSATRAIPQLTWQLGREISEFRPDAVLNLLWLPSGVATLAATRLGLAKRTLWYVWAHAVEVVEAKRNFKKRLRKTLSGFKKSVFRSCDGALAVSSFTADAVSRFCGVEPSKITAIYNGVDCVRFTPGEPDRDLLASLGIPSVPKAPIFLTVSRMEDYKGVDVAIRAFARVLEFHTDARYIVVGGGSYLSRLKEIARECGVGDRVVFTSQAEDSLLPKLYRSADCFVLLTRADWEAPNLEGFGIVFLEAAASGIPSIGGRSGGIPDAVSDGETGVLVDPLSIEDAAHAMREMIERPEWRREMGLRARARAEAGFTWKAVAERILNRIKADVRN